MAYLFERVTVAGVGLIGGSLALAARAAGLIGEVAGLVRSPEALAGALGRGLVDRGSADPAEAARGADLLVLAVPVRAIAAVARQCLPYLPETCILMDVGSVKAPVVRALEEIAAGRPVVGTHPVAGNEKSGPEAARPDLFAGALCVLTPTERTPAAAADRVEALWQGVGMRVERLAPERHDAIYAAVSHLPHAVAFSLLNTMAEAGIDVARYGAGSFKSATRVAGSSVEMCRDFLLANAAEVDVALARFTRELERLRAALGRGDEEELTALLARANDLWRRWDPGSGS